MSATHRFSGTLALAGSRISSADVAGNPLASTVRVVQSSRTVIDIEAQGDEARPVRRLRNAPVSER